MNDEEETYEADEIYDDVEGYSDEEWDDEVPQEPRAPRNKLRPTTHHWLGFVVAGLATLVYALGITNFPFPGISAALLTHHSGIDPLRPLSNPIFGVILRTIEALPFSTFAFRMNLFSAICAGVCVWLVFELGYRFLYDREKAYRFKNRYVISGLCAALFFAVSTPVWFGATRAHYVMFDLALMLGAIHVLTSYRRLGGRWRIIAFSLLFSITAVEYPTALLWAVPLGAYLLLHMFKHGDLKPMIILGMLGCALVGLSLYFLFSWHYYQLPVAEWRQVPSYWKVVAAMGHEQYTFFQRSLPKVGWLSVALMSVFPWALCALFANFRTPSTEKKFSLYFFLIVLLAIGGAVLFNTIAAPWRLVGYNPLLVAPYALLAISMGWCISQVYTRLLPIDERGREKPQGGMPPVRASIITVLPFVLVLTAAAYLNYPQIETRSARVLHDIAEETLEDLGDRKWLLTENMLDDLIALAAADRGQTVHLLNAQKDQEKTYRNYTATLFESTRKQSLAKIGLGPLISDWFNQDPTIADQLAIEHSAAFWTRYGYTPLNQRGIVLGLKDRSDLDLQPIYDTHLAFWDEFVVPLQALDRQKNPASPYARRLLVRLSRAANNLGVLAEEREQPALARAFYQQARVIFDDNLSALLNEYILASQNSEQEADQETIAFAEAELRKEKNRIGFGTMTRYFGFIRDQAAVEKLRQFWNVPEPPSYDRSALVAVQEAYVANKLEEALKLARKYVDENPDDETGWNIVAVIAGRLDDEDTVYECIQRMQDMGRHWAFLLELAGRMELDNGKPDKARRLLEQALKGNPNSIRLLELLVNMDMRPDRLNKGIPFTKRLLALDSENATGNLMMGMIHYRNGDYNLAINAFSQSVATAPTDQSLNNLAWTLYQQGRNEEALPHIQDAIARNGKEYTHWDTLGMILAQLERPDEAITALTRAAEMAPDQLGPQLHRALVLADADRRDEARELANELLNKFAGELNSKQRNQLSLLLQP